MFSVIIPLFNGGHVLPRAVTSVLNQTYQNFEVIIVDDGSTDGSLAVARELSGVDARIAVYATGNSGGPARPRNYAIARSRGEFIAFLDQDDWWLPTKLQLQYDKFRSGDFAVVYSDCLFVDPLSADNGLRISEFPEMHRRFGTVEGYLPEGQVQRHLIVGNFAAQVTVVVRADWFTKVGGMDESLIGVDCYEHLLRVALAGGEFGVVRDVLAVHARGPLSRDQEVACAHTLRFFRKYARRHREHGRQWTTRIQEYEVALLRARVLSALDASRPVLRRLRSLSGIPGLLVRSSTRAIVGAQLRRQLRRTRLGRRLVPRKPRRRDSNRAGVQSGAAGVQEDRGGSHGW